MREQKGPQAAGDRLLDVVVVGGGSAGPVMAWHLARQGRRCVVLDAAPEIGHTWRSRWDPFAGARFRGALG